MDQLIVFMGLAKGTSRVRAGPVSLHTKTAIALLQEHSDAKFTVTPIEGGGNMVECNGIGLSRGAAAPSSK